MTSATDPVSVLKGLRILVVEDSFLIAHSLTKMLRELGCLVVGPAPSVAAAREAMSGGCDAAILDVNLGAETSIPIAQDLAAQGTPFIFVTGYSSPVAAAVEFKLHRRLRKPLTTETLRDAMLSDFIREG
jgi:DNA-binding response OmpR family regulator